MGVVKTNTSNTQTNIPHKALKQKKTPYKSRGSLFKSGAGQPPVSKTIAC